jgi:hypothetical protein
MLCLLNNKNTDDWSNHILKKMEEFCDQCGQCPCEWEQWKDMVIEKNELMFGQSKDSNTTTSFMKRKALYKAYVCLKFGTLGKGNRVVIDNCVLDQIRSFHPDPNNNYMGHMTY